MRVQDAFGNRAGLEQGKTEQNRVADNAPDGCNRIVRDSHRLDKHSINAHTDQDEEALETQGKEAAPIWLCSWLPKVENGMGAKLTAIYISIIRP